MVGMMIEMERKIVRIGGSYVVAIPKVARKLLGLRAGDRLRMVVDHDSILMVKVKWEKK